MAPNDSAGEGGMPADVKAAVIDISTSAAAFTDVGRNGAAVMG